MIKLYFLYFQISLGRMAIDILKFLTLYLLVLFAFACGMNQLLWYYADGSGERVTNKYMQEHHEFGSGV